ncbi:MAG: hypothetical protein AAFR73_12340 [Pseudomonadota bacterium]
MSNRFFPELTASSASASRSPFYSPNSALDNSLEQAEDAPAGLSSSPCGCVQVSEAKQAYDEVQRAYNKAVTLCRTKEINKIWPALCEAKTRWLAAELRLV